MVTVMKDDPAPAPCLRATARGVDNGCNFEGGWDGETTTAPASTATAPAPATDMGRDDDTGANTSNNTRKGAPWLQDAHHDTPPTPASQATARGVDRGWNDETGTEGDDTRQGG